MTSDPLIELSATVPAAPETVLPRIAEALRRAGGGRVEVDHDRRTVAVEGGWWYRGEYQVAATAVGTRITHRVRNVASTARWAVPLANRLFLDFRGHAEQDFAEFVAELV